MSNELTARDKREALAAGGNDKFLELYDREVALLLADDDYINRLAACKDAGIIETLMTDRVRQINARILAGVEESLRDAAAFDLEAATRRLLAGLIKRR